MLTKPSLRRGFRSSCSCSGRTDPPERRTLWPCSRARVAARRTRTARASATRAAAPLADRRARARRGAKDRHGRLRRPRRLHRAGGAARSGGRAGVLSPYHAHVRAELERHGGTVEKFIGDAVMAVFGAPVAHEDDPERAVRAALAIRDWSAEQRELQVRIAVNTGEALVNVGARPGRGRGDGRRRRRQHGCAAAGGGAGRRRARRRDDLPGDARRDRLSRGAAGRGEGQGGAGRGLGGGRAASRGSGVDVARRARRRWSGASASSSCCARCSGACARSARPSSSRSSAFPGSASRGSSASSSQRGRREPELVTWRQGRCLPYGEGVTFWALGEIVKAEAGILETDAPEEAERKLSDAVARARRRGGRGALARAQSCAPSSGWPATAAGRRDAEDADRGLAPVPRGDRRARARRARVRGPALGGRRAARLRRRPRRLGRRRPAAHRRHRAAGAAGAAPGVGRRQGERDDDLAAAARRGGHRAADLGAARRGRCSWPTSSSALLERAGGNPLFAEQYVAHAARARHDRPSCRSPCRA